MNTHFQTRPHLLVHMLASLPVGLMDRPSQGSKELKGDWEYTLALINQTFFFVSKKRTLRNKMNI